MRIIPDFTRSGFHSVNTDPRALCHSKDLLEGHRLKALRFDEQLLKVIVYLADKSESLNW